MQTENISLAQKNADACNLIAENYVKKVVEEADERINQFREIIRILERAKENSQSLYEPNFLTDEIAEDLVDTIWEISSPRSFRKAADQHSKVQTNPTRYK